MAVCLWGFAHQQKGTTMYQELFKAIELEVMFRVANAGYQEGRKTADVNTYFHGFSEGFLAAMALATFTVAVFSAVWG